MESRTRFLGLILVWALIAGKGRTELIDFKGEGDQVSSESANPLIVSLPNNAPEKPQIAERRLSLEDFFMNRNNQQQQQQQQPEPLDVQQLPLPQFQVQQPNPNAVLLVRDAQFPSANGGLLSRLVMARRMLRLRRWARRLRLIPTILGLGLRQRQSASEPQPVVILNNRIGQEYNEPYNPRDYVLGNKAFSFNNSASSQENSYSRDQSNRQTSPATYSHEVDPYFDNVNDLPYDLYDIPDPKTVLNYQTEGANLQNPNTQKNTLKSDMNGNRQVKAYDSDINIQQKLRSIQKHQPYSEYQQNNQNPSYNSQQLNEIFNSPIYPQKSQKDLYQQNKHAYDNMDLKDDISHSNQYQKNEQALQYSNQHNPPTKKSEYDQSQELNDLQLQLLRKQQLQLLQIQLLREQQRQLDRERQLQSQEQGNNYQQSQQYQNQPAQQYQNQQSQQYQNQPSQQYQNQQSLQYYNQPSQQYQNQQSQQYQNQPSQQYQNQQSLQYQNQPSQQYQNPQSLQYQNQPSQQYQNQQSLQYQNQPSRQYQNQQSQIESESPLQNYPGQTYLPPQQDTQYGEHQNYGNGDRTLNTGYEKPLIADSGSISKSLGSSGNVIGVGINVGIKPPAVDVAVIKPVSPVVKPLPSIVNTIFPKPVPPPAAVAGPLVPLGILPKPILNLNGRVFFGAEVGKGVKVGRR